MAKYPDYFYENRPDWVKKLDEIKISTKPNEATRNKKYCGNCKFYLEIGRCKISKKLVCIYDKACECYKRTWWKFWVK